MIPNKTDRTIEGSLPGNRIAMGFDSSSLAHVMKILTELYSDPELACIREYACNALDSHSVAGQTRPIEVETPGPLSPYLRVRDFGIGLTMTDIEEIYSRYGASTKRNDNGVTGMLGVGCKSALAYTSQFTVVARRDGVQITVAISRDEDGGGSMTVVDTCATREINGVEVVIPAKGGNAMGSKAVAFFSYWAAGTVLLNGKPPKALNGLQITPDIMLADDPVRTFSDRATIVMGNVPYPAADFGLRGSDLGIQGYRAAYYVVARVPIGSVDFAPSREALMNSKQTSETVARVRREFRAGLVPAIEREVEKAASPLDAIRAINAWSAVLGSRPVSFVFKGQTVPTQLVSPGGPAGVDGRFHITQAREGRGRSSAQRMKAVDISYFDRSVFVTGFEPEKMTVTHKDKILQWIETRNFALAPNQIVLCPSPLDQRWLDPDRIVPWATIKAIKLVRPERLPSGRIPGSYDIDVVSGGVTLSRKGVPGSEIDQTKPIFWEHGYSAAHTILRMFHPDFTVVKLSARRIDKWKRDVPTSINAAEEVKRLHAAFLATITDDQKLALYMRQESALRALQMLRPTAAINDPDLARAIKVAHLDIGAIEAKIRNFNYQIGLTQIEMDWNNPLDKYPLVPYNRPVTQHAIDYINWHYAASK